MLQATAVSWQISTFSVCWWKQRLKRAWLAGCPTWLGYRLL